MVCITPFPQTQCHCLCCSSCPFPTPKPRLASLLLLWSPLPKSTPSCFHLQMHKSYDSPYQTKFIQCRLTNTLNPFEQVHSPVTSFPPTLRPSASTTISPQHCGAGPHGATGDACGHPRPRSQPVSHQLDATRGCFGAWHQNRHFPSSANDTSSITSAKEQIQFDIPTTSSPTFCALHCFVSPHPQTDVRLRQYKSSICQFFWNILTISKSYRRKKKTETQQPDPAGVPSEHHPHVPAGKHSHLSASAQHPPWLTVDLEALLHMSWKCIIPLPYK